MKKPALVGLIVGDYFNNGQQKETPQTCGVMGRGLHWPEAMNAIDFSSMGYSDT